MKNKFLNKIKIIKDYKIAIKNWGENIKKIGTAWLLSIVKNTKNVILNHLPSFI